MFLSYEETKDLGYDNKTKLSRWEYKIIDSEFEETETIASIGLVLGVIAGTGFAIIDTYEKRNLNVAANLIRALIWLSKEYGLPISYIINWNKQYNPKFAKYEDQINKYLILI